MPQSPPHWLFKSVQPEFLLPPAHLRAGLRLTEAPSPITYVGPLNIFNGLLGIAEGNVRAANAKAEYDAINNPPPAVLITDPIKPRVTP